MLITTAEVVKRRFQIKSMLYSLQVSNTAPCCWERLPVMLASSSKIEKRGAYPVLYWGPRMS